MNFNDFINHYRIEAVKEKLSAGEHNTTTLLGIAYDCGFNSKATFNRAFKKSTTLSPNEYLKKNDLKCNIFFRTFNSAPKYFALLAGSIYLYLVMHS